MFSESSRNLLGMFSECSRNVLGMFSECSRNVLYFGIILGGGLGCNRGDLGDFRQGNRQRGKKLVRPRLVKIILGVSQEFV